MNFQSLRAPLQTVLALITEPMGRTFIRRLLGSIQAEFDEHLLHYRKIIAAKNKKIGDLKRQLASVKIAARLNAKTPEEPLASLPQVRRRPASLSHSVTIFVGQLTYARPYFMLYSVRSNVTTPDVRLTSHISCSVNVLLSKRSFSRATIGARLQGDRRGVTFGGLGGLLCRRPRDSFRPSSFRMLVSCASVVVVKVSQSKRTVQGYMRGLRSSSCTVQSQYSFYGCVLSWQLTLASPHSIELISACTALSDTEDCRWQRTLLLCLWARANML